MVRVAKPRYAPKKKISARESMRLRSLARAGKAEAKPEKTWQGEEFRKRSTEEAAPLKADAKKAKDAAETKAKRAAVKKQIEERRAREAKEREAAAASSEKPSEDGAPSPDKGQGGAGKGEGGSEAPKTDASTQPRVDGTPGKRERKG